MGRITKQSNLRVVVEPRGLGNFGYVSVSNRFIYGADKDAEARALEDMQDRCKEIMADIRRHVDNVGDMRIESDEESLCEHCGWRWTEESDQFNGGCCDEDMKNEPAPTSAGGEG